MIFYFKIFYDIIHINPVKTETFIKPSYIKNLNGKILKNSQFI